MSSGTFTTGGFYGARNKRKWLGLERAIDGVVKKHQAERIPKSFPSRVLGPSTKWQTFFRQQDAFKYSRSTSKDLHVFAFESDTFEGNTGQRMYLVTSYPVFWHYYNQVAEKRHHYEVIPEGAVCKLYFDLEYDVAMNPDCKGDKMVDTVIKYVCMALGSEFGVTCSRADVLDLDASTATKFSRHLIFQSKNAFFKDNINAGRFVTFLMSQILARVVKIQKEKVISEAVKEGIINLENSTMCHHGDKKLDGKGSEKLQNSSSVMSSCKKTTAINNEIDSLTKDKDTVKQTGDAGTETDADLNSGRSGDMCDRYEKILDKFTDDELQMLVVKNKHGDDIYFCDTGVYTKNRNFRLYQSSKLCKNNPLKLSLHNEYRCPPDDKVADHQSIFYDSLVANVQYTTRTKILTFNETVDVGYQLNGNKGHSKVEMNDRKDQSIEGYNKSPYPEVDEYITELITRDGGQGLIRHWIYFQQGELLVYEILRYRFCHNIGRQHRSNNIMYIVDLHQGVFYQKCHDPECHLQNYKSQEWALPQHVLPASYFDDLDNDFDLDMNDEELLNMTLETEQQYLKQNTGHHDTSQLDDSDDDDLVAAATDLETSLHKVNVSPQ